MPRIIETARISGASPPDDAPELVKNAWLIWTSVTNECLNKKLVPNDEGYYMYSGTLRAHVLRLWPSLTDDERVSFEKSVYGFMKEIGAAKCIHRHSPTVWQIKRTWDASMSRSVPVRFAFGYTPSRAEANLTPHEAGEDRPPGAVTVTTKETYTHMTQTQERSIPSGFVATHEKRAAEQAARRELVVEWLADAPEPVVAEEVAAAMDMNIHTIRNDLTALVEAGAIFSREETADERVLRYGGVAFARRSRLFWKSPTIPPRVSRIVVDGITHEPSTRTPALNGAEINRRLWVRLKRKGPSSRFTMKELADAANVHPETVRSRFRTMTKRNLVAGAGHKGGARVFKIVDKEGIREYLEQPPVEVLAETVVTPPPLPAQDAPVEMSVEEALSRAIAVVAENVELRRENEELRQRIEDLTRPVPPAVDPQVLEALSSWQPRSS